MKDQKMQQGKDPKAMNPKEKEKDKKGAPPAVKPAPSGPTKR
jgi:hypothetical protein